MADSFRLPPRLAALLEDMPLEQLAFSPVPVKPRHDGWTAARQAAFILRLALIGCVAAAAKAVGKSRESAYRLREHPGAAGFAAVWDRAQGWGRGQAVDLGLERALLGETRGVYYRGRKIAEEVRHDNRLLIAMLQNLPPEPQRDEDPNETFRQLLAEIDPEGAASPGDSNDILPRTA
jgi:hypothetical protein